MENHQVLINFNINDFRAVITYLKDYSTFIGKSFHQTNDKTIQKQLSDFNFEVNRIIIKLEKELKDYES